VRENSRSFGSNSNSCAAEQNGATPSTDLIFAKYVVPVTILESTVIGIPGMMPGPGFGLSVIRPWLSVVNVNVFSLWLVPKNPVRLRVTDDPARGSPVRLLTTL
jgi:hypothetical protein